MIIKVHSTDILRKTSVQSLLRIFSHVNVARFERDVVTTLGWSNMADTLHGQIVKIMIMALHLFKYMLTC